MTIATRSAEITAASQQAVSDALDRLDAEWAALVAEVGLWGALADQIQAECDRLAGVSDEGGGHARR